jgi:hypothetical protein
MEPIVIPFIESVPDESKESVTSFVTNSGATAEELKGYDTFDKFLSGYKPKSQQSLDWTATLPEEDRALLGIKGWKNPSDTIKGYKELEKLVGHDKIAMPKRDKNGNYEPGELERVMTQLGRPKDAKEYKPSATFKLPEGMQINEQMLAEFQAKAHKNGLLPHQYSFMMDELSTLVNQGFTAKKAADDKAFNDATLNLRAKFGLAYDEKTKLANSVLRNFSDNEDVGIELVKRYGNDPFIIGLLANVGAGLSEESLTRVNMISSMLTPESAKAEIVKVRNERAKELMDASHPQHAYWLEKLSELYRMAGG